MQANAELVVIGAGIVGCSAAYHLAQQGWQDIVVLDQGPLFATGGSSSHAPGLVFQTNASRLMTQLAKYTVSLYSQLETAEGPAFYPVGGIEVADSQARWQDLKRKLGWAKSWGVSGARLLSPAETKAKIPLLDETKIFGAYYVPTDGIAKAVRASQALATEAMRLDAATFYGNTKVLEIEVANGRVQAVVTDRGRIDTNKVLVCAGIWGPRIGRMVGEVLPLTPVQHQYVKTSPLSALAGETQEVVQPILRHQDRSMYFRQHGDCYGIGSYQHEPLLIDADEILDPQVAPVMPSVKPFTAEHFQPAWGSAVELLPALAQAELTYRINGLMSFTPDGFPLIGESLKARGFWVAEAVWVTHGGGVGKVVAELMSDRAPSLDLHEADLHRFPTYAKSRQYIWASVAQQYREVYDIIHPLAQPQHSRPLRLSPFYPRQVELGAEFFTAAGWERPQWFNSNAALLYQYAIASRQGWEAQHWSPIQGAEHRATRDGVALFDLTPFTKLEVTGKGALAFLEYLCANQIDRPLGKVIYTSMLDANGGIVCDLTVTRLETNRFLVITGAASGPRDLAWMRSHLPPDGSVQITDLSASYCSVGLWGPLATQVLEKITPIQRFPKFTARQFYLGSIPVLALHLSYVGEAGWELYAPSEFGLKLWDLLWEAGQPLGLVAAGGGAFESLRLEKGFLLAGTDLDRQHNPFEAGLGLTVRLEKGEFLGREALLKLHAQGIRRKLCYLTLDDPGAVVMGKEPILAAEAGHAIGYVTSAGYGYNLGRTIAYGYLPWEYAAIGAKVYIEYFGIAQKATVVQLSSPSPTLKAVKIEANPYRSFSAQSI